MAAIQFIVLAVAATIFTPQCMISSIAAANDFQRFSNIMHIARDVICQVNGSSICTTTFLSFIKKSGKSIEIFKLMQELSRASNKYVTFRRNEDCHVSKKMAGNPIEVIPKDFEVDKKLIGEEIDVHMLKKLLRCTNVALKERHQRDVGAVLPNQGSSVPNNTICWPFWRGDGFCDLGCNIKEYNYDDGDCCYETCISKKRRYPCGYTGFQCKMNINNAPSWSNDLQLCFKWRTNGDKAQCDRSQHGKVCAPFGSMTKYYYDDTDERNGGCALSWSIRAETAPSWFWSRLQLCLFTYSNGDTFQCNYGKNRREKCRRANYWLHYVDDTDNRPGGCFLRWRLMYLGMVI